MKKIICLLLILTIFTNSVYSEDFSTKVIKTIDKGVRNLITKGFKKLQKKIEQIERERLRQEKANELEKTLKLYDLVVGKLPLHELEWLDSYLDRKCGKLEKKFNSRFKDYRKRLEVRIKRRLKNKNLTIEDYKNIRKQLQQSFYIEQLWGNNDSLFMILPTPSPQFIPVKVVVPAF